MTITFAPLNFKMGMEIKQPLILNMMFGIFLIDEKINSNIRSTIITDVLANPDNYSFLKHSTKKNSKDVCISKVNRVGCLYIASLMIAQGYITLGDAFDSTDYDRHVSIRRRLDLYLNQYHLLTPNILKRINDSGEYADVFLDPDIIAIMNKVKESNIDLDTISFKNTEQLKANLMESMEDFKSALGEMQQTCDNFSGKEEDCCIM